MELLGRTAVGMDHNAQVCMCEKTSTSSFMFPKVSLRPIWSWPFGLVQLQYSESRLSPQSQDRAMASRKVLKSQLVQRTEHGVNKDCGEHEELLNFSHKFWEFLSPVTFSSFNPSLLGMVMSHKWFPYHCILEAYVLPVWQLEDESYLRIYPYNYIISSFPFLSPPMPYHIPPIVLIVVTLYINSL